jgi:uncharacterized integral membrane protein
VLIVKRILTALGFIAALAVSALFTSLNPGVIDLDLGFASFETPVGLAFVLALGLGWLLGLLSAILWITRLAAERRRLRGELKRSVPVHVPVPDERG